MALVAVAALAMAIPGEPPDAIARRRRRNGVHAQGPCGNGEGKANRCKNDRQCCTGYCRKRRKKGKRGTARGRCRCRLLNQPCTQDRNCCPERTSNRCLEGRCLPDPVLGCAEQCSPGERCWQGQCACGDVCASGCQFTSILAAINASPAGSTIRICAGTYSESITIGQNLTLIGAGSGDGGTLIETSDGASVISVDSGVTVTVQAVQITGRSNVVLGGGVYTSGNLTLRDCLITDSLARECGGGIYNDGSLTLVGTRVTANTSDNDGAGICVLNQGTASLQASTVSGNTAGHEGGGVLNGGISLTLDAQSSVTGNHPDNCAGNPVAGCIG